VKYVVTIVIGLTVVLIGVAMIVLPGPALIVIPLGLAILATELVWARRLLKRVKKSGQSLAESIGLVRTSRSSETNQDSGNAQHGKGRVMPQDDPECKS